MDETAFIRLADAKSDAGVALFGGKGVTVDLGGCKFNMLAKGTKGYEWVMTNDDVRFCLAKDCQGGRVFPEAFAEFNSAYLWRKGHGGAYNEFRNYLNTLAVVEGEKVNRADLCLDLAADLPIIDIRQDVVTRAVKRVDYHEIEHYTHGCRDTGYRFGSRNVLTRIYDKGNEITRTRKLWFRDIWRNGGWDGESGITRVENQVRRAYLKKFGVNSYADLVSLMPDIWRVLTTEWLVIKKPNETDSNHRRWKTSGLWETVQKADNFGVCLGVQPWQQKQARIEPLIAQMKGLMVSEVALDCGVCGEYHAIMNLKSEINNYLDSDEFKVQMHRRQGRYGNISGRII